MQVLANLFPNLLLVVGMFVVMLTVDPFLTLLSLMTTPLLASRGAPLEARRCATPRGVCARPTARSRRWPPRASAPSGSCRRSRSSGTSRVTSSELSGDSLTAGVEAVRLQARFAPMVDAAGLLSTLIVMWVGATRVADGQMQLGVLLIFLTYVGSLYKPVKALSKLTTIFTKGMAAAERIDDVLSTEPDINDRPRRDPRAAVPAGSVRFDEVTFSYGREPVLWAVSFDIDAGETVALVGPTGAGKSTLAALVPAPDRPGLRPRPDRRSRRPRLHRRLAAFAGVDGAAGHGAAARHHPRQHRLRSSRRVVERRRASRQARTRRRVHRPSARRSRHPCRRARRRSVGWPASAHRDRPSDPPRRADPDPRRTDQRARHRIRGADRHRPRQPAAVAHDADHRPPALDRAACRPDRRARRRHASSRRARTTSSCAAVACTRGCTGSRGRRPTAASSTPVPRAATWPPSGPDAEPVPVPSSAISRVHSDEDLDCSRLPRVRWPARPVHHQRVRRSRPPPPHHQPRPRRHRRTTPTRRR